MLKDCSQFCIHGLLWTVLGVHIRSVGIKLELASWTKIALIPVLCFSDPLLVSFLHSLGCVETFFLPVAVSACWEFSKTPSYITDCPRVGIYQDYTRDALPSSIPLWDRCLGSQDPLQVSLVKTVAALLDCKIGSNLLTNIIILRFFLMFLQITLTCQSSGIELFPLENILWMNLNLCGLCPFLVTDDGANAFVARFLWKIRRDWRIIFSFLLIFF